MNKKFRGKRIFLFAAIILLIFSGCEDNNVNSKPDDQEIVVSENTTVISDENRQSILTIDSLHYTFTIEGGSDLAGDIEPGVILVDSASTLAPNGYLRKVVSIVNGKDGNISVITEQATIPEAVNRGEINFSTGNVTTDKVKYMKLSEGTTLTLDDPKFNVFSFDFSKTLDSQNGSVTLSGHTELNMDLFFWFKWDWEWDPFPHPYVERFETGVELTQLGSIMCESSTGFGDSIRVALAEFYFTPWTFMLGPVPVVFVPKIELFIQMDGSITAELTMNASESFTGRLGSRYTNTHGWEEISENYPETDFSAPDLEIGVDYRADLGPEISLLLYGIAGPFANVTGFQKLDATFYPLEQIWDMYLSIGVQSQVGIKVNLLGFSDDWSKDFILFEEVLIDVTHEPLGDEIYIDYPVDGQSYLLGEILNVETSYTGATPDSVRFIVSYNYAYTDFEEPFEYEWDTNNVAAGLQYIGVESYIDGEMVSSDAAGVYFEIPVWEFVDLSSLGFNDNSVSNDLFFLNTSNGWLCADNGNEGSVLKTVDSGNTWSTIYTANTTLKKIIVFNNQGDGILLAGNNKVLSTSDNFENVAEMTYQPYGQPSFQWNTVHDIAVNNAGEVVAVCKDTGIPYQFNIHRASIASHEPTGTYILPYPNEYGLPPMIKMFGDRGILFNIYSEDETDKNFFMTTIDGGVTWSGGALPVNTEEYILHDGYINNEDKIFIAGEKLGNAILLISDDFGNSWLLKETFDTPMFSSINFVSDFEGYATIGVDSDGFEPKVYHTLDAGENWQPMIDSVSKFRMNKSYFLGPQFGIICGKGQQILRYSVE
ncbi:MAG: hypothetical protein JXR48_06890 [Candidatus Delongbacteria bacterium]|nr:hypothetical protein [Candidatus Delongbacteria bacterium]MBN2834677.1 hypothetical protein [Candidatus Delongbacteria bacterium]